jgi:demethylmenaquinone methyltransferase/2-methoxy-6-polyprenyl-1,4-benzoquinol methylase
MNLRMQRKENVYGCITFSNFTMTMKEEIVPYARMPLPKKEQVALMFDRIAFRYDLMNRLLSFGIDVSWRKKIVRVLRKHHPKMILDVATGTADVALELASLHPTEIIGVDISGEMLALGREKIKAKKLESVIHLQLADSENLPYEDNKFDAVTVAFGVRNFENLDKGLSELFRVLKTGGRLVILEFSKPYIFPFKQIFHLYFTKICPALGSWITNDKMAYEYLHRSVESFPDGRNFTAILDKTGFIETQCTPLTFGISSIYTGSKS